MSNPFLKTLSDEQQEQMFNDLFDKAVDDGKNALIRTAKLMEIGNVPILLIMGAAASIYGSVISAVTKSLTEREPSPGDYGHAQAVVDTFEISLQPEIDKLKALIAQGVAKDPKVAQRVANVAGESFLLRTED